MINVASGILILVWEKAVRIVATPRLRRNAAQMILSVRFNEFSLNGVLLVDLLSGKS